MKTWAVGAFSAVVVTTFLMRPSTDPDQTSLAAANNLPALHKMADWSEHLDVEAEDDPGRTGRWPVGNHALMDELMDARDYRVLFESLLANPTEKSGLYAMHILARCQSLGTMDFHATSSHSTRQDEARQRLEGVCKSFTPEEVAPARWQQLLTDPRIQGRYRDLLRSLRDDAADPVKRRQVVREILETRDPLLIAAAGSIETGLIIHPDPAARPAPDGTATSDKPARMAVIYGQQYRHPDIEKIANYAWRGAICKATGTHCGPGDYAVMLLCATSNHCMNSRVTALRQQTLQDHGPEAAALYDRMQPQLVSAIRNINVDALGL